MGDTDITIRQAVRADVPALVELMKGLTLTVSRAEEAVNPTPADYERIFDEIASDPHRKLVVAEVNGLVCGAADLLILPNLSHHGLPWAVIENLIVDERIRRQGIARTLVEHLVETARTSGCYKIGLSSDKRRTDAHRLYQSAGFDQYGLSFRMYF